MNRMMRKMFESETSAGILLLIATIFALLFQNLDFLHKIYHEFLEIPFMIGISKFSLNKPLEWWVNDFLMAIFFFSIGLELKREMIEGELRHPSQVMLPSVAALGGVLTPALIYSIINWGDSFAMKGWAIPTATDIAFAVGVLALLGKKVPSSLKIFILTLAIMDDLCAIVIIALFYGSNLQILYFALAGATIAIMFILNRLDVDKKWIFIVLSLLLWIFVLNSGVHATIAGVIAGFLIPIYNKKSDISMLKFFENFLRIPVNFAILPLFAFVNAGVDVRGMPASELFTPVALGISCGLFFGKQIGIFLFSFVLIKLKFADMPTNSNWLQLYGISILCGIGFTMALFVDNLAFVADSNRYMHVDKLSILIGSLISGVVGYFFLKVVGKKVNS